MSAEKDVTPQPPFLGRPEPWLPEIGTTVYLNRPDGGPLGEVVGYVTDEIESRRGQPILERYGKRTVIHPMFLLPMRHGSPAHRKAMERDT